MKIIKCKYGSILQYVREQNNNNNNNNNSSEKSASAVTTTMSNIYIYVYK